MSNELDHQNLRKMEDSLLVIFFGIRYIEIMWEANAERIVFRRVSLPAWDRLLNFQEKILSSVLEIIELN